MGIHFGKRIKETLEVNKGLNVNAFAGRIGISETYAYRLFKQEDIHTELLRRISEALGVSLAYWFSEGSEQHHQVITGNGNKQLINSVDYSNMEKDLAACLKENQLLRGQLKDKDTIIELLKPKA